MLIMRAAFLSLSLLLSCSLISCSLKFVIFFYSICTKVRGKKSINMGSLSSSSSVNLLKLNKFLSLSFSSCAWMFSIAWLLKGCNVNTPSVCLSSFCVSTKQDMESCCAKEQISLCQIRITIHTTKILHN